MFTPKTRTRRGTITTPPPRPVSEPSRPARREPRQTRTASSRVVIWCVPASLYGLLQFIEVQCHAHGGVHTQAFECADFAMTANSPRSSNRHGRGFAQRGEPFQVGATHGAFVVHISTEEFGRVARKLREDIFRSQSQFFLPAANEDLSAVSIHSDDDAAAANTFREAGEETIVNGAVAKGGAAHDNFFRAGIQQA